MSRPINAVALDFEADMTEEPADHHWISLHHVRFPSAISALERAFPVPTLPEFWQFCPNLHIGENGLPTFTSDIWCGLAIYDNRSEAEAMVAAASRGLPFLSEAVEHWDALLLPFAHRGSVNWRGTVQDGSAIRAASARPDGSLAVITSAGFNSRSPDHVQRVARFSRGVREVVESFGEFCGNLRSDAFVGYDQRDSFTVSLWRDAKAMTEAAYWKGTHRTLMDQSRDGSLFIRSSFTRAHIVSSRGSWDGDPLQATAQSAQCGAGTGKLVPLADR